MLRLWSGQGPHRPGREPNSGVRSGEARSARVRATQVRLSVLQDGVMSPPPPVRPIARGIAGPGLSAQIIVAKFGDHLPLYRQEDFFTRHGLHIPRSTLCDWVQAAAELLRPLYERQKEFVLQSPVLWTDDTPVTVLTGGQEGSRQGRFWAYIGEKHPYTVYDFTESRARDGPAGFLRGFQGYLHADAYTAATTRSISGRIIRSAKLPAGPMRGVSSSTRGQLTAAMRTRSWSGSGSCTTSRIRPARCRPTRGVRSVCAEAEPVLDRIDSRLAELERAGAYPRVRSRRRSGMPATSGRRFAATRRMVD